MEEAGSPASCRDRDGTEYTESEFMGCVSGSDDSFLDSTFEEELDRLLEPDNTEHPPYLMETETLDGEENSPCGPELMETREKEAYPLSERRLKPRAPRCVMNEDDGVDSLPESEVVTSRASECIENVSDGEVAPQRGLSSARKSTFPPGTPSPTKSKRNAHAAPFNMTGSCESSGEDAEVLSPETEAMKSRPLKRRKTSIPETTPVSRKEKPRTRLSAKSKNNDHAANMRWRTEEEPNQGPKLVTFTPTRIPGPQLDTSKDHTVLELFQLFFSYDVVKTLCSNTNENAKRRQGSGSREPWTPVCVGEMYKYLSVVIYMGLLNVHTVSDYWSQDRMYSLSFCRTVMTMTRFLAICFLLHMSDPSEDEENERKKGTAGYDRLMRIQPLKDQISEACRAFYHPFQNLSIDERVVRSKACNSLGQDIKTISFKCGFKLCVLADSGNGYTCDFDVLTNRIPSASGAGGNYHTVTNLLNVAHLGTGYHVYVGHAFASAALLRDLHRRKLGVCGPVREGPSGVQEDRVTPPAPRGTVQWLRDGDLLFTKWLDTQPVIMCSTIREAIVRVKRGKGGSKASNSTQSQGVPAVVESYNKHKGGVELSDHLIKCYSVAHKTTKWYNTFFYHFVDIAVVNGFLLHKELAQVKETTPMTHKQFREELCLQLADIGVEDKTDGLADKESLEEQVEVVTVDKEPGELVEVRQPCYPVPLIDTTTVDTSRVPNPRRQCCMCKEFETYWQCGTCQVALCLIPDRNCFRAWHMDKKKLVAEIFKRQIKYNPYPHPWMVYGGKKIEFKSKKQARCFIKRHFGLRNNKR